MLQNSVDQGGMPPVVAGTRTVLSFWAKGSAGATGHVPFALRYLESIGNTLYSRNNQFFKGPINTTRYSRIPFTCGVVLAGASAAFTEFSQGIGPMGTEPAVENFFEGIVLIDELSLSRNKTGVEGAFAPSPSREKEQNGLLLAVRIVSSRTPGADRGLGGFQPFRDPVSA